VVTDKSHVSELEIIEARARGARGKDELAETYRKLENELAKAGLVDTERLPVSGCIVKYCEIY